MPATLPERNYAVTVPVRCCCNGGKCGPLSEPRSRPPSPGRTSRKIQCGRTLARSFPFVQVFHLLPSVNYPSINNTVAVPCNSGLTRCCRSDGKHVRLFHKPPPRLTHTPVSNFPFRRVLNSRALIIDYYRFIEDEILRLIGKIIPRSEIEDNSMPSALPLSCFPRCTSRHFSVAVMPTFGPFKFLKLRRISVRL